MSLYRDEHNVRGAIVELERAIHSDPANAEAHLLLGNIYGESELYARAEPELRRAVTLLVPEASEDPDRAARLADARNSLAAALINLGRPAEAVPLLQQVVGDVHYASQHLALANLGLAYLALHRNREAAETLERSVAARPNFCVGHARLGEAYLSLSDYGRALEALDRALNNQTQGCGQNQHAFLLRGRVHTQLHQPDAARADFSRCREMAPHTDDGQECAGQLRTEVVPPSSAAPAPAQTPAPAASPATPSTAPRGAGVAP